MSWSFTLEQLLDVFEKYNLAIWPMQVLAYLLGIVALYLAFKPGKNSNQIIAGILAFLWLWTAVGFFPIFFGPIYTPAYVFGVLFFVQGVLFLGAVLKPRLSFHYKSGSHALVGLLFIAYALLGYPLFGYLINHIYPQAPPFGLTPCPLAVFTFGFYLLTDQKVPRLFLVIPTLWALGGFIPVSVGILEDIGLILSGVIGAALILYRDRQPKG